MLWKIYSDDRILTEVEFHDNMWKLTMHKEGITVSSDHNGISMSCDRNYSKIQIKIEYDEKRDGIDLKL